MASTIVFALEDEAISIKLQTEEDCVILHIDIGKDNRDPRESIRIILKSTLPYLLSDLADKLEGTAFQLKLLGKRNSQELGQNN